MIHDVCCCMCQVMNEPRPSARISYCKQWMHKAWKQGYIYQPFQCFGNHFLGYPSSLLSTTNHNIHPWKLCLAWDLSWRKPHYPLWVWWCAGGRKSNGPETMWSPRDMGRSCDQQLPHLCDLYPAEYYKSKFMKIMYPILPHKVSWCPLSSCIHVSLFHLHHI